MNHTSIQGASLSWNQQGTPVSQQFDDVYFSNQDGLAETRHVFLQGNGLPQRWCEPGRPDFTVAETGFGTGLNFLTLWQAHRAFRQAYPDQGPPRLHFISFEKYPLCRDDLRAAHAAWPELAELSEQLYAVWPDALPGCHRLHPAPHITLDLWFGDVNALLPQLPDGLRGHVDAWFLDGFAPAKNPDMWTQALFDAMLRLARPGATFATFTAAGFVRRGLIQAGFEVSKVKGFGQKRECLAGRRPTALPPDALRAPWYARPAARRPDEVALIGGGIAAALCALALQRRGSRVTLYCADPQGAQGASGNRQGALYPLLNGRGDALERFYARAFPYALRTYDALAAQGVDFPHQWCGVSQLGYDDASQKKIAQLLAAGWPEWLAQGGDAADLGLRCGLPLPVGGVCYPLGGWLDPAELTRQALALAERQGATLHFNHEVRQLQPAPEGWRLRLADGSTRLHGCVVLAGGARAGEFSQSDALPLYPVRGQVSHIPTAPALAPLRQVLCHDGYLTPCSPNYGTHCLGASYRRNCTDREYSPQEQQDNRQRLIASLPQATWPQQVDVSAAAARIGIRCAVRDHLPLVGALPDAPALQTRYPHPRPQQRVPAETNAAAPHHPDLFILAALGSRGLCSAPLCAELLAGQIHDEALPLEQDLLDALSPNRFWLRKWLKGKGMA
ncbi:bifunctional tRNA (5-methylaminomethyl-2-thiouridine)(34)-methyltransferase MnmD/FAD-dependent 5-carboxymethylaminomethyl-2-thiouridine(34) oxidoreductase MnmC [Edwardsiella anguillarum]|uniref:bifunctional tRNA (5-methylaminomethyl-2-thiouridine)(34)-methyltransferase MnmD/FAD-dependent 5-carboxymethylaminomethyl-2-thiouridine(34) oxidoreductase MnmC n=1 Tax=Edwardsiella anguillarum TaxID=1821960 RepID=UPI0024B708C3|nr:bifunctional tRNA (5-methylaminomethyl-2-thiouridine)(34)-methyltransferase MnmD/FAD-dependent 5-carboxymethylaminomethyl-2-thiouridine(34) oxidoreductase MnmC [Edwardsiella anguillarum]WHP79299.1 bifunctional tRNA (5-methylaminomethyl-2-thiouridine)(34)-methyltransferase MnmD/FAD-dependent 5-carboxymethylaminomethyl-2-thiouridine(34) oxidoreductase MnmC [Edwardsiella anguillarum]WHQ16757.1 bifunctional tRNA (5-methylaminomethyl-2-thiouridine)(34)-methyltransferase MnmD/FAD-dependent 5-carboxy